MPSAKTAKPVPEAPKKPLWAWGTQTSGMICIGLGLCYPWWSIWKDSTRQAVTEEKLETPKRRPAMILLPVGKFQMGSELFTDERPVHEVALTTPFAMSETEVTQAQYQEVMGMNPSYYATQPEAAERPVENVSWFDAIEYCNRLSDLEHLDRCYQVSGQNVEWNGPRCNGYRLPTEAEWEYAARADDKTEYAGSDKVDDVAWYGEELEKGGTHPVKQKNPNQWGLYDLSGNVWEWVWDRYGSYDKQPQKDPAGPPKPSEGGAIRVVRGGSWWGVARGVRVAVRAGYAPAHRDQSLGFRLVRSYP